MITISAIKARYFEFYALRESLLFIAECMGSKSPITVVIVNTIALAQNLFVYYYQSNTLSYLVFP